jgi:HEAT repeat protein
LEALTKTGVPEAASVVADSLLVPDGYSESAALSALAGMGQAALPRLIAALRDPESQIRQDAARALRDSTLTEALPALRRLVIDPDELVRSEAQMAIGNIEWEENSRKTRAACLQDPECRKISN